MARQFKVKWEKAEQLYIAACLQHTGLASECQKFVNLSVEKIKEIDQSLQDIQASSTDLGSEKMLVLQMKKIYRGANDLLGWMANRVDPQNNMDQTLEKTNEIAKDLLSKAIDKHHEEENLRLMREAE